jgi:hypothetical protein
MIVVGIDEAGYGPMLGPLVVSAATFRVPGGASAEAAGGPDLWSLLRDSVTRRPDGERAPVDDSKRIHRPGKGVGPLEEGVLPFLHCSLPALPPTFRELLRALGRARQADAYLESYPWYAGRDLELPAGTYANFTRVLGARLAEDAGRHGVEILGLASSPVEVLEFNRVLADADNKALIPFRAIGAILARLRDHLGEEEIDVTVDRQGGRINYARLLFECLQPRGVTIECQTPERSSYRVLGRSRLCPPMRVTFTRQGDSKSFAVALASMASKYVRELHMELFNRFWTGRDARLRPTAGYPTDARRFLGAIAGLRRELGVGDEALIRRR